MLTRFCSFFHGVTEDIKVEQVWLSLTRVLAVQGFGSGRVSWLIKLIGLIEAV